jgi:hypothetical protein
MATERRKLPLGLGLEAGQLMAAKLTDNFKPTWMGALNLLRVLLAPTAAAGSVPVAALDKHACTTDGSCSPNGVCHSSGSCRCFASWSGLRGRPRRAAVATRRRVRRGLRTRRQLLRGPHIQLGWERRAGGRRAVPHVRVREHQELRAAPVVTQHDHAGAARDVSIPIGSRRLEVLLQEMTQDQSQSRKWRRRQRRRQSQSQSQRSRQGLSQSVSSCFLLAALCRCTD